MKGYPVTRDELFGLGGAGALATACFSIGGGYISRSLDIEKDLELNQGLPKEVLIRWQSKESDYWTFGILFVVVGVVLVIGGGLKIFSVIKSTRHSNNAE